MGFKKGDMVCVSCKATSYGGAYKGVIGIITYSTPDHERYGVALQNHSNPESKHGWFYFKPSELVSMPDAKRTDRGHDHNPFTIKKVYFNDPVTVVIWGDGTKTIVRCQENDNYDPEIGLAMAISKKALGNKGNYYNTFKKYLSVYEEEEKIISTLIAEIWNNSLGALYKKESK